MVSEIIVNLVSEFKDIILVKDILALFDIAKSTYYRWKKDKNNMVQNLTDNEELIINLCKENKFRYGYRKITALANRITKINKNTVQRIMQKFDLQCRVKIKKNRKYTHQPMIFNNEINGNFKSSRPFEKLATDITYLPFGNSMQYLSSIIDMFNGEIVAQTISDKQDLECVKDTLNQLPKLTQPCILHSDQGAVYTSKEYQLLVKYKSITMSMSRKGTPSDNAPIESFHSVLKSETFYLNPELKSSNFIVSQTVVDYIKYYNNERIQEKLGYVSPVQFRMAHTT